MHNKNVLSLQYVRSEVLQPKSAEFVKSGVFNI